WSKGIVRTPDLVVASKLSYDVAKCTNFKSHSSKPEASSFGIRRVRTNPSPTPFDADNASREARITRFSISYPVHEIFAKTRSTSVRSGIRRVRTNPRLTPFDPANFAREANPTRFPISYQIGGAARRRRATAVRAGVRGVRADASMPPLDAQHFAQEAPPTSS